MMYSTLNMTYIVFYMVIYTTCYRYHRMMLSRVKPLHDKVISTTSAVDDAEHKMSTLDSKRKALEARLKDLAKGFEDATIDKNDQEKKTIKMTEMLDTATHLRQVSGRWLWVVMAGR